ncbi:MAG: Trm112 family protein [Elusimicrobia bacterium]|nr:Trm112 family protein [Elusimicrobiota bacterium]
MTLAKDLLEVLACPQCKGVLDYRETENKLVCGSCRLVYEVKNDIPVMIPAEASPF